MSKTVEKEDFFADSLPRVKVLDVTVAAEQPAHLTFLPSVLMSTHYCEGRNCL